MFPLLNGLRIIEGASFIAGPSCGLHLAQMGAEVIRFDQIGGGPDFHRWPLAPSGASLYWEGLNKGKKSVAIDLSRPEGRELAVTLAASPGENAGLFVTNFPLHGFLSYERLAAARRDIICLHIMGWADGTQAVDYTVNSAIGVPYMTGPSEDGRPVNHVVPAWDLLAGAYGAFTLLAAERERRMSGTGRHLRLALSDLAAATLGNLGQVAEVSLSGQDRPRYGNDLFGAFGRDFTTRDGRRVMVVAITARQWQGLVAACRLGDAVVAIERELRVSLDKDEGMRFIHRERLNSLFAAAILQMDFLQLAGQFDKHVVCWSPYQSLHQAVSGDTRLFGENPIFSLVEHSSGAAYPTPGAPLRVPGEERQPAGRAPRLGEHTDEVLSQVLELSSGEIGRLHAARIVASADQVA
jgi:2-methylfumaryl-CoA isomerase